MRARFLRGSDAIAVALASLENHLAQAPFDERESVRVVAWQIAETQERLKAQMDCLPASARERFNAIVSVLKAQQAPLEQLSVLVEQHVLPRQLQNLSVTPVLSVKTVRAAQDSAYGLVQSEHAGALRHARLIHREEPVSSDGTCPTHSTDALASRGEGPVHAGDPTSRSLLSKARKQAKAILNASAAMIVATVFLSPFVALRESKLRDITATPSAVSNAAAGSELPPTPPPARVTKLRNVTAMPSAVSDAMAGSEPPPTPPPAPATIPQMDAQRVSLSSSVARAVAFRCRLRCRRPCHSTVQSGPRRTAHSQHSVHPQRTVCPGRVHP
jgi:hypothetical protein